MTDKQDETKTKKLTLGGSKFSLGNKSVYPKKPGQTLGGGSVVVEIKRGKVTSGGLSLNRGGSAGPVNQAQDDRRLAALQKSKEEKTDDVQLSTLSRLAEINQELQIPTTKEEIPVEESVSIVEKTLKKEYTTPAGVEAVKEKEKSEEEAAIAAKPKNIEPKKLKKSDIINMLDQDAGNIPFKTRSLASIKRARAKEKRKTVGDTKADKLYREVTLPEVITVAELANRMTERAADVTRELMKLGVMATSTQSIDADTAELIITSFGHTVKRVKESDIENILINTQDNPADLKPRAPIVTVMGHVDHGKTSLLDALKETDIVAGEAGGITQHIGAYSVKLKNGDQVTFLDTPGHEAFTAMRARGAKVTDIAIIIVAADDNIMPQTEEAISHAKAAEVPIVFAINKIDKPGSDPERIKQELAEKNMLIESWGGKYQSADISAKNGTNIDALLEEVVLAAELLELKANPERPAKGTIIEAELDKGRGYISTILVQTGTLRIGDIILAGAHSGKIKAMYDERNNRVEVAGPSTPVQILGLDGAPQAGETFYVMKTEKEAREIADKNKRIQREQTLRTHKHITLDEIGRRLQLGNFQEINIIIKGDVIGSVEAVADSLIKLGTDEIQVKVIHKGVGQISEADVMLAAASDAIIIGFQVRPALNAKKLAEKEEIDIRLYSIIYQAIEELKAAMEGMLSPEIKEEVTATVEIRDVFKITKSGKVAGCFVLDGKISRDDKIRLIREGIVKYEGELGSLRRFKDDVKEVVTGMECGLNIENFNDIKVGDIVEAYRVTEIAKTL